MDVGWREGLALGVLVTWTAAAYCYWFVRKLEIGVTRLLASIPVLIAYAYLPLIFSRETHLVGVSAYYCIFTWLGSSKVLLLCWGKGPAYDPWVATSFFRFAAVMSFPAHIRREGRVVKHVSDSTSWIDHIAESETWSMQVVRSVLKLIGLGFIVLQVLPMRESLPQAVIYLLYSIQLYLFVTIVLEILAVIANTLFGIQLEPLFDNPIAAASLEEFWARRWNLLMSNSLRETVYQPVLHFLRARSIVKTSKEPIPTSKGSRNMGDKFTQLQPENLHQRSKTLTEKAPTPQDQSEKPSKLGFDSPKLLAMLATFFFSGLAHDLAVYYISLKITGEVTAFFTIQGIATAMEAAWRIHFPNARPSKLLARFLTLGFVFFTSNWLFWPPMCRGNDLKVIAEVQRMLSSLTTSLSLQTPH